MAQLIDDELRERLLSSIAGDSLIILCGAGLSMADPSRVSSARHVAQQCAAKYKDDTGSTLPDPMPEDVEVMAEHFFERDEFQSVFIRRLVDWREFVNNLDNLGHVAIADFLGAKLVDLVVSTNVDTLIERAATTLGEPDFCPIISEDDINFVNDTHAPLLKLHGCASSTRRRETVWCKNQLNREPIKSRIEKLAAWLRGHLPNRDLIVVGFWTDWAYLNHILENAVVSTEPRSVIVIDPSSQADLKAKSPELWQWAQNNTRFRHIEASGDTFLNELRLVVSCHFVNRVWAKGKEQYVRTIGREPDETHSVNISDFSTEQLYSIRRDLTGVPVNSIVRNNGIDEGHSLIGMLHLGLLLCGATLPSNLFHWNGSTFRIIHTPNESLSSIQERFSDEPPNPVPPTRTICVGAWDDGGVPSKIIARGVPQGIIRNSSTAKWEPHRELLDELHQELKS